MLDHAAIAARIPHQGSMCLLAAVVDWSRDLISCRAISHPELARGGLVPMLRLALGTLF